MSKRILLWSPLDHYVADLLGSLEHVDFLRIDSKAELKEVLPSADAMVLLGTLYDAEVAKLVRERASRLRWIQLTTAGYDGVSFHGVPSSVVVTNAGHIHGPLIAEHAVTLLTALVRRLPCFAGPQSRHTWDRGIPLPLTTLEDATVAVLGYGGIGREIARRLKSFDATVVAIARAERTDDFADRIVSSRSFHSVLRAADALVVACSLTDETMGMVNAAAIAAFKPGGVLVNIARGGVVDTMAVVEALHSGHLYGAGLDVTSPEPLPSDHPLWSCPNLIITPHVAAFGSTAVRRRFADLLTENIARFQNGQELEHQILRS
jgi:phosphoglycerate dehydrogenase-like enzyme